MQLGKWIYNLSLGIFFIGLFSFCKKKEPKTIPSFEIKDFNKVLQLDNWTDTLILKQLIKGYQGRNENLKDIIKKEYANVQDIIPKRKSRITSRQIDYAKIISTYDSGDLKKTRFLLENTFRATISEEELEGYLVACYYGLGLFREAAKIKFKTKTESKQELHDYAKCLRNIGLTESHEKAEHFNDSISTKGTEDNIWIYIPIEVSSHLFRHIHSIKPIEKGLSEKDKLKLYQFIINQKPTQYLSLAYYLLGYYDLAVKRGRESFFYDLYLYAHGYAIVQKYSINYIRLRKQEELTESEKAEVKEALSSFRQYIELYPGRVQADDAAYWIAFCQALLNNHLDIFTWLNKMDQLGNKDDEYQRIKTRFKAYIIDLVPLNIALRNVSINSESKLLNRLLINSSKKNISSEISFFINDFNLVTKRDTNRFQDFINSMLILFPVEVVHEIQSKTPVSQKKEILKELTLEMRFKRGEPIKTDNKYISAYAKELPQDWFRYRNHLLELECDSLANEISDINSLEYYIVSSDLKRDLLLGEIERRYHSSACPSKEYLDFLRIKLLNKYNFNYRYYNMAHQEPSLIKRERYLKQFIANYPNGKYLDEVLYALARLELVKFNRYRQGEQVVLQLLKKFPNSKLTKKALNLLANCSIYDSHKYYKYNNLILSKYPKSELAAKAQIRIEELIKRHKSEQGFFYTKRPYQRYHIIIASSKTKKEASQKILELVNKNYLDCKIITTKGEYLISIQNFPTRQQAESNLNNSIKEFKEARVLGY